MTVLTSQIPIVLGSQSPQRAALLRSVLHDSAFTTRPPRDSQEMGFENLHTVVAIETRLKDIVYAKYEDVVQQLLADNVDLKQRCVICADTIVVANSADGQPVVLGKPPETNWKESVRGWFVTYYCDRVHEVWTSFLIGVGEHIIHETVKTQLSLEALDDETIDWYLSTGEPIGKAGGYGVQGIAAMFVKSMAGSLTNVVGLPMLEVTAALRSLEVVKILNT